VAIFFDDTFGQPQIDGISAEERTYAISDYLLKHYRPLLDIDGQLILIRDDLYGHVPSPPSGLTSLPQTSGMYDVKGTCSWGYIPNFLATPSSVMNAEGNELGVRYAGVGTTVDVQGWAVDGRASEPALGVVAVADDKQIALSSLNVRRPDVVAALGNPAMLQSGFDISFDLPQAEPYRLYAINRDSTVTPIPGLASSAPSWTSVSLNGHEYPVRAGYQSGDVQSQTEGHRARTWQILLPRGQSPSTFSWLELQSSAVLTNATYTLSDPSDAGAMPVTFRTLPRSGHRLYVEVGSCLTWHGFSSNTLLLSGQGAPPSVAVGLEH
jgi:hypothetical protein